MEYKTGKLFKEWSEWRAMVIKNFMTDVHNMLRSVNKKLSLETIQAPGILLTIM
jgi:uncharacterized lipoprotein YddW (UPF0748 family)